MWLPAKNPWHPPEYDEETVYAIRAVAEGIANDGQQKLFWRYLMYVTKASEEFADLSYRPDSEGGRRDTDFAEGKRFVGLMLRKLLRAEVNPKTEEAPTKSVQERLRQRRAG